MRILFVLLISLGGLQAFAAFEDDNPATTQAGSVDCPDGNCYKAVESKSRQLMSRAEVIKLAEALLEKHETPKLPSRDDSKAIKEGK